VELVPISAEVDKRRETFFRLLFEGGEGYICIAYADKDRNPKSFREEFFAFPNDIPRALELINQVYQDKNVWFCPHLFRQPRRKKEFVSYTPCAWADLDECDPDDVYVTPTISLESSPGRYVGLWVFDSPVDPDDAENLSQRIAYAHAEHGADRSGWDLTQLLRMPYTHNFKYATAPQVKVIDVRKSRYRVKDFEADYEDVAKFEVTVSPRPTEEINGLELLDKQRLTLSPTIWRLYNEQLPDDSSWSEPFWKLMIMLFEAGFSDEQVYWIVQDAACNKWDKHDQSQQLLWKDVCKAKAQHDANVDALAKRPTAAYALVSDEERLAIQAAGDTFIERYITWAKSLGDAAPQYHQAGAFTVLSSLLSGSVVLPTSFGTIKPNLWFMILADTTLTRKSTAMDIAMDLVMEVDEDVLMATDGSIEGLLTSLSTRPGRPSVFLRDEFSGLLEMITKKDYYAGMPELFTKLYDGKLQKRILRKESIEVKDPCLLVFAGGIKNKITGLLTFEHVSSGFMPRFIFITAESDVSRVRPLGPPTDWIDNNRSAILEELEGLYAFYNATQTMEITGMNVSFEQKKKFPAKLTPEAWHRYNELEATMLEQGMASERPEIMTPVYDRLSKSILKCSVLLAASREKQHEITVTEQDVVRAIVYGENWKEYVDDVMANVGKGQAERQLDNVRQAIERRPGVSRSYLMQSYHLDARGANIIFETLEQRGLITRQKIGKAETLWPVVVGKKTS
jgi:hypothetical protein